MPSLRGPLHCFLGMSLGRTRWSRLDLPFFPGHAFSARVTALTAATDRPTAAGVGKDRNNNLTFERPTDKWLMPQKRGQRNKEMGSLSFSACAERGRSGPEVREGGRAEEAASVKSGEFKMRGRDNEGGRTDADDGRAIFCCCCTRWSLEQGCQVRN